GGKKRSCSRLPSICMDGDVRPSRYGKTLIFGRFARSAPPGSTSRASVSAFSDERQQISPTSRNDEFRVHAVALYTGRAAFRPSHLPPMVDLTRGRDQDERETAEEAAQGVPVLVPAHPFRVFAGDLLQFLACECRSLRLRP